MKTESKPVIEYFHRGRIEKLDGTSAEGYSANDFDGKPYWPPMTRVECVKDAKAKGKTARFNYGNLEERANFTQPHPSC